MEPYFETELGQLYLGDYREIMPNLNLKDAALLTDPLYGEGTNVKRAHENETIKPRVLGGLKLKRYNWPDLDDKTPLDPTPFLSFDQAIIWGGNYIADRLPPSRKWIIWDKLHIPPDDHHDCEMAWTNLKGVSRVHRHLWRGICREGEENIVNGPKLHPFQKPLRLMVFCISQFVGHPQIFDPFIGSGTTAVACEKLKRRWIGIEIKECFCETAAKRIKREAAQLKLFAG